ncbi:hypothetical protein T06_7671, partial [Trichinella sp. T6]
LNTNALKMLIMWIGGADWEALADIDAAQQPIHSTMNTYFNSGNKDNANIILYSNYPPHFKFELPMSPGKGVIMAEDANKGFWLVHTAKYFPNLAGAIGDLFSNEKTKKDAAAFLCMTYSDVNLRAIDTEIPKKQDSARWSVPKSDPDFVCLSNTGRTANDAKYGATVACVLSKEAADLFRKMITKENSDACP